MVVEWPGLVLLRARRRLSRATVAMVEPSMMRALLTLLLSAACASAQIADQVLLFGIDNSFHNQIARFDRKLNLLGLTKTGGVGAGDGVLDSGEGVAVDGQGRYWIPFDALNDTKVLRMEANGTLILPSVNLQHNPVYLATAPTGITYVLTRIPLLSPAPLYGVSVSGTVLGSSLFAPLLFLVYPYKLEVTPAGEIWIGGVASGPVGEWVPQLVRVDPGNGAALEQKVFEKPLGSQSADMYSMATAPDGTLWAFFNEYLTHIVDLQVAQQAAIGGSIPLVLRVDAQGNLLVKRIATPDPYQTQKITRYDAATLTVLDEFGIGGIISQYGGGVAIGASGEDLFISGYPPFPPYPRRLWRFSLVTGTGSSVDLSYLGIQWDIPLGDPTGFIWANVRDQQGDADGDGATNRTETLAGSNPFDPLSRPAGPKVYVSFLPTTNALVLTWVDPDGLLDPSGGLDLSTLSVTIGNYGNVFYFLLPFATALDLSADMKQATLTFGALPLPFDKKWQVEATIADLSGATGWDWQVTPPGDL
jgi:hypothetical protein